MFDHFSKRLARLRQEANNRQDYDQELCNASANSNAANCRRITTERASCSCQMNTMDRQVLAGLITSCFPAVDPRILPSLPALLPCRQLDQMSVCPGCGELSPASTRSTRTPLFMYAACEPCIFLYVSPRGHFAFARRASSIDDPRLQSVKRVRDQLLWCHRHNCVFPSCAHVPTEQSV